MTSEPAPASHSATIGLLGEELVAQWLQTQGWSILHHRWHCRWGELDLIARRSLQSPGNFLLAFIEVKTRSQGNWDETGLLSITSAKQKKLWLAARSFLAAHPDLAELPCQFDLALVQCKRASNPPTSTDTPSQIGQPIFRQGYQFVLQDYLVGAIEPH